VYLGEVCPRQRKIWEARGSVPLLSGEERRRTRGAKGKKLSVLQEKEWGSGEKKKKRRGEETNKSFLSEGENQNSKKEKKNEREALSQQLEKREKVTKPV